MFQARKKIMQSAHEFLKFVNASPSPYHVVEECRSRLSAAGFKEIRERDHWDLVPNHKYFMTRNQSTIIAFAVGGKYAAGNGFTIVGAHTDSPCLRVKVKSAREKLGYIQVGAECYGGGIWGTWFDRDLKLAGRVLVADGHAVDKIKHRLVHIDRPILRIPHLAIHLQREMNDKFSINKETQLVPILATQAEYELNKAAIHGKENERSCKHKHHPALIGALAKELSVNMDDIVDFDLCLADHQPSAIGGIFNEFIFSPRLDNLVSSYTALVGLVESCDSSLADDPNIRMICLYDNEEVGSMSAQGAGSSITEYVMRRISTSAGSSKSNGFEESVPKSFMISADMAHGIHPNYPDKHEDNHRPSMHGGPVIKVNNNQRYATTAVTATVVREVARLAGVKTQDVMVRNDSPCGSTIGPILSGKLGLRTCDFGGPQLSMHSCREMCGVSTISECEKVFQSFFKNYPRIDANLEVE